jgi:hypothetical protein
MKNKIETFLNTKYINYLGIESSSFYPGSVLPTGMLFTLRLFLKMKSKSLILATLRLFNSLPVKSTDKENNFKNINETLEKGFLFTPDIYNNYKNKQEIIELVSNEIGLSSTKLNQSFHKSWKKVKEAKIEQLLLEQLTHYFTTYGFEQLGIYDENSVYIPNEKIDIPKLDINGIKLILIKGITNEELKEKLLNLLNLGVALHEETIKDVLEIAKFVKLEKEEIENLKNKEVKIALYEHFKIFPNNSEEFLRYLIFRTTGKTLLIKNQTIIEEIKPNVDIKIYKIFKKYEKEIGLEKLSEIFNRYKPLFLAFKEYDKIKPIINKIRKLAKEHHKPMKEDFLNNITSNINKGNKIDLNKLEKELNRVNLFRKIRLAYSLNYKCDNFESILYRIRNGKGYGTTFKFKNKRYGKKILKIIINSITEDIKLNVNGKKIYIPEHITYTLPATEKQFTDKFPSGTYINIKEDMVAGIHWENVENKRVDLDLSLINTETGKIGWNSSYRTEDRSILFSGDVTDAPKPKGASELYYIKKKKQESFIMIANYFNFQNDLVPFKIIIAKEKVSDFNNNYMVNPNNVIQIANSSMDQKQKIIGFLITTNKECRFYFSETCLGKSISSSATEFVINSKKYLTDFYQNAFTLKEILKLSGAKIVTKPEKADIDLSPEKLEKNTILDLLKK